MTEVRNFKLFKIIDALSPSVEIKYWPKKNYFRTKLFFFSNVIADYGGGYDDYGGGRVNFENSI